MKKWFGGLAVATLLAAPVAASAAGMFGNWPIAGQSPYMFTFPLSGLESIPVQTNLPSGNNPANELVTVGQLGQGNIVSATNTTSFTATTSQMATGWFTRLLLTGALAAGATVTTPTASAMFQALQALNSSFGPGSSVMQLVDNESSGAFAWTVAGGTGVTMQGTTTVAQGSSRCYLITFPSSTTATMQSIGNGC